jgi:hypothetical protein
MHCMRLRSASRRPARHAHLLRRDRIVPRKACQGQTSRWQMSLTSLYPPRISQEAPGGDTFNSARLGRLVSPGYRGPEVSFARGR